MSRPVLAALVALTSLGCKSAAGGSVGAAQGARAPGTDIPTAQEAVDAQARIPSAQETSSPAGADDPNLSSLGVLLDEASKARASKDYAGARARIAHAIEEALSEIGTREDAPALELLARMGSFAHEAGEFQWAEKSRRRVHEVRSRILPEDDPDLQRARLDLASTIGTLGDLAGARTLQEKVLEVRSRTLPDDDPLLQNARGNLALTIKELGDLAGARALQEKVLEIDSRTLPDDHPDLQTARMNFAVTIASLGDLAAARVLFEKVLEVRSRTLPDDHPDLQAARLNLALTLHFQGDLARARPLEEKVLEIRSRTLPDDHPALQKARQNLALTVQALGDLEGARALEEKVLEVRSRTLPGDHPDLQKARGNLAITMLMLGDADGARAVFEKLLESLSRTLPDEHPDLQKVRANLAGTLYSLGDYPGARALYEKVVEILSRTLPDEHRELQAARLNLASAIQALGDLAGALALEEKVLEVYSRTPPNDHSDFQKARLNLAVTASLLGDLERARSLEELALKVFSRTLPDDDGDLQAARRHLAWTLIQESVRDDRASGREGAGDEERVSRKERCTSLIDALCRSQTSAARAALLGSSAREAQARCEHLSEDLGTALSFAGGLGVFDPSPQFERASFDLSEITRGAALSSAALMRHAAGTPRYTEMREELRKRSEELATLVENGATSESFHEALAGREAAERGLLALARELSGGSLLGLDFDLEALAGGMSERDAIVAWRRYKRTSFPSADPAGAPANAATSVSKVPHERSVDSLCAFVVRSGNESSKDTSGRATLTLVELGPMAPIEQAVREWRASLGVGGEPRGIGASRSAGAPSGSSESGTKLRQLVFDPVQASLRGADHVILVLDDVLHLVPMDALPDDPPRTADKTPACLGDRLRLETRVTTTELLAAKGGEVEIGDLLVVGGVDYGTTQASAASRGDGERAASTSSDSATADTASLAARAASAPADRRADEKAGILRGGAWSGGFVDLPATREEARAISREFDEHHAGGEGVRRLEGGEATRERLLDLAPRARWLHVATHGWCASESIRSWKDPEPLDRRSGLGQRLPGVEQVRGMSPMLICGLALAGANLPESAAGRVPGLITAEEFSALDLSRCELAVLSACDTNVGEQRAGQGVASLQMALQMAGARSVITSLWKVPDEPTKDLMLDFYRRLWVEKKPKWQALWEAKSKIRNAKDEAGRPKYTTRDWAAWVLTGDPN